MFTRTRTSQRRVGVAAVELAIVLPLLVTLMLGCIDAGRMAYSYVAVRNASSEAATWGSLHGITEFPGGLPEWIAAVQQIAVHETAILDPEIEADQVTVDTEVLTEGRVRVVVEYEFHTVVPWPAIPSEMVLKGLTDTPQVP